MRVVVTGGAGYLGRVICAELAGRGILVRSLDSGLFRRCLFPHPGAPHGVEWAARDIRDVTPADFEGFHAVIHLAGLCNDPLGDLDPALTMAINHRAAVRVGDCARAAGVGRMVCASSCSVYGASGEELLTEASPTAPVTAYARAKLRMEEDIAALAGGGFAPVFLRPATVFGAAPGIRFDLVVNNLVAWAMATGEVRLKSDGMAWRPIVHVADVARAFALCLTAPLEAVRGQVFNLVDTAANYRVRDIARIVAGELPGTRVAVDDGARRDRRNYRVDGGKLGALLGPGWPRHDLRFGIGELRQMLADAPTGAEAFEGRRFERLAHLRAMLESGEVDAALRPRVSPGA